MAPPGYPDLTYKRLIEPDIRRQKKAKTQGLPEAIDDETAALVGRP
jgi:hypothetical protein